MGVAATLPELSEWTLNIGELLSVQDQISTVSKHNTEIVNHLQTVKYSL